MNVEIKARCRDAESPRRVLREQCAEFRGLDHQVDTYFAVPAGRLKLREGNIENHLIWYARGDQPGPKRADVLLMKTSPRDEAGISCALKDILAAAICVRVVVDKRREIYFIDNVKFHLDDVAGLGRFVEIEAQSPGPDGCERTVEILDAQCRRYLELLGIGREDLIDRSYSDMLLSSAGQDPPPSR